MLTIYSKNVSFQKNENDMYFGSLGYGVLRDLYSDPLITEELNGSYILEFSYKIDGSLNEYLVEENVIKACGQPFVIYDVKKDTSKISILAKHWVLNEWSKDFLLDVAPTDLSSQEALNWIQKRGNNQVNITVNGDCDKVASARYVRKNIINAIYNEDNALLTRFGGELSFDKNSVFVHKKRGNHTGLTIRERKNLSGIEFHLDFSTVATKLLPLGKDGLLLDEIYVESPLIDRYLTPIVKKVELDTEDQEELYNYCQSLFENNIDKPSISIKIDFIELSKTTEYKKYSNIETVHLGDTVTAYIPSLDLNIKTRVVKTIYNCNLKRITSLELGTCVPDMASSNATIEGNVNKILNEQLSFLAQAKSDASDLMKHPFGGYIFFSEKEGCIYIADNNDLNSAVNVWKWGLGGLGFSSTGVNGTYETAITQDGSIVADFIKTGTISASRIEGYSNLLLVVSNINKQIEKEFNFQKDASGSNIHLEDSSDNKLLNLSIEGKSWQENIPTPEYPSEIKSVGYENLLDMSSTLESLSSGGITFTKNSDGTITANGTSRQVVYYNLPLLTLPAGSYYLNGSPSGSSLSTYRIVANYNGYKIDYGSGISFTLSAQTTPTEFYIEIRSGVTLNNVVFKPMITKETKEYPYIPYGKYGIEVVNTGKNLLKGLSTPLTDSSYWFDVNKTYFTPLENGWGRFSYDNTNGSSTAFINAKVKFDAIKLKPNTTYTIVTEIRNSEISKNSTAFLQLVTNNSTVAFQTSKSLGYESINTGGTYKSIVTTKANFDNVNVAIDTYLRLAKGTKGTVEARISLFEGDVEIDVSNFVYEPYKEHRTLFVLNEPLRSNKDETVREIAYIKNNKLYVERKIKNVILTGDEVGFGYDANNNAFFYTGFNKVVNKPSNNNIVCVMSNYFKGETANNCLKSNYNYCLGFNNLGSLWLKYAELKSLDDFKNFLSIHNVEVQYELAEPIIEELGKIEMPNTYKNVTNITTTDELEPIINLTYLTDTLLNAQYATKGELKITEETIKSELNKKVSSDNFDTTLEEMNNTIEQKITASENSINSSISNKYITKVDSEKNISSAKTEAINSANTTTDNKLKNYSTTTEMNNSITQKVTDATNEINIEVNKKVNDSDYTSANIIAKINGDTSEAGINADKIVLTAEDILNLISGNELNLKSRKISIVSEGLVLNENGGKIANFEISQNELTYKMVPKKEYSQEDLNKIRSYIMGETTLSDEEKRLYDINGDGKVLPTDYVGVKWLIEYNVTPSSPAAFKIHFPENPDNLLSSAVGFFDGKNELITGFNYSNLFYQGNQVIESGSNENGNYIKYADGTLICYKVQTFTNQNIDTSWGSLYETANPLDLGYFPQDFVGSYPAVFLMPLQPFFAERKYSESLTEWGSFWAVRPAIATGFDVGVSCIAIGKWK